MIIRNRDPRFLDENIIEATDQHDFNSMTKKVNFHDNKKKVIVHLTSVRKGLFNEACDVILFGKSSTHVP